MAYVKEQTRDQESWRDALAAYPPLPLRARFGDAFVSLFPRRLFTWLYPVDQEKVVSHAIFFRKALEKGGPGSLPPDISFGLAGEAELDEMSSHSEALPAGVYARRVRNGDICYYLRVEGKLVSYNWINLDCFSIYGGFQQEIRFPKPGKERSVYTYDFYTYSDCRGGGHGARLKSLVLDQLADDGVEVVYACVHHDTRASLRVHREAGYDVFGVAYMYRLMSHCFVLWSPSSTTRAVRTWLETWLR